MFVHINNKRGQSTLEYAVVIAVIVGALLATQVYIKRGIQGRLKQASDDIGEQFSPDAGRYDYTTTTTIASDDMTMPGNEDTRGGSTTSNVDQLQEKTGTDKIKDYNETSYGL